MKKAVILIACACLAVAGYSQREDCRATLNAAENLYNHTYPLARYSILNVPRKKDADHISKLLDLRVGDTLSVNKEFLCTRFSGVLTYKTYYLHSIYCTVDSLSDPLHKLLVLKFEFTK